MTDETTQQRRDEKREAERRERVERLLGTDLRKHLKPASELRFTPAEFERATAIARASR